MTFSATEKVLYQIGGGLLFFRDLLIAYADRPTSRKEVLEQTWRVFTQSFSTTAMAGFFVGAIMSIQFALQMREFGALGYLGGLSTSGTIREVGPLLIAFMLSGKIGAFTSAELGTMRVTEQIDAIRCLGANPLQELVLPRYIGIVLSSFFLLGLGLFMSIFGGMLTASMVVGVNPGEYVRHIPHIVSFVSVLNGLVKCFVFSVILATVCTYVGYTTSGGAKGVGRSVVNTAVATMVGIVLADWLTSFLADLTLKMFAGTP